MSINKLALALAICAATCVAAQPGHALNNRTFVSNAGLAGNSAQGCSAASPCDTFAHALSVTASGGEINCLNVGDFGTVTITQAVTIDCESISAAGVQVTVGNTNGITITATGPVNLIGLDINGTKVGETGVQINSAATVTVRNCKIYGWTVYGIAFQPAASGGSLVVDNGLIVGNSTGITEDGNSVIANMSVRNSKVYNNNNTGISLTAEGGAGSHAGATIEHTTLAFNNIGLELFGGETVAVLGGSTLVNNNDAFHIVSGNLYSFQNNQIGGNSTDGTPLTAYPGGPLN